MIIGFFHLNPYNLNSQAQFSLETETARDVCLNHQGRWMLENAERNREEAPAPLTISFTVTTHDQILDRSPLA